MSKRDISDAVDNVKIIDTHEHFSDTAAIRDEGASLFSILPRGYLGFFDFYPGLRKELLQFTKYPELHEKSFAALRQFIENYHEHEFLDVLDMGIKELHGTSIKRLTEEGFQSLNQSIEQEYASNRFRDRVLMQYHVERVICDVPHHSGGLAASRVADFDPALYRSAMRINSLIFGFDIDAWNPGTCLMKIMAEDMKVIPAIPGSFSDFLYATDKILDWSRGKGKGKVASCKCASAYERTIDFGTKTAATPGGKKWTIAKNVFGKPFAKTTDQERLAFGDVVMHYLLGRMEGKGIPLQFHTGSAIMPSSHPGNIESLLADYPGLDFTLLHCGYPWTNEAIDIVKRHPNARAEMVWLPMLSRDAATAFLERAIVEGLEHKVIAYGGDCACIEGSVGALLALRSVVKAAIGNLVERGKVLPENVESLVTSLFHENPRQLFFSEES
jgi:hypothetical protein